MSLSVLIADDSKLARRNVVRSLPLEVDFAATEVTNGQEAVSLLADNTYSLVLLDLTMPKLDGIDVLERLQTLEKMPNVVVISADFQPEKQRVVKELGAKFFLRKPLKKEDLTAVLSELGYL